MPSSSATGTTRWCWHARRAPPSCPRCTSGVPTPSRRSASTKRCVCARVPCLRLHLLSPLVGYVAGRGGRKGGRVANEVGCIAFSPFEQPLPRRSRGDAVAALSLRIGNDRSPGEERTISLEESPSSHIPCTDAHRARPSLRLSCAPSQAEQEYINGGQPKRAVQMYTLLKDWPNATRVAESSDPALVADVLVAQGQSAFIASLSRALPRKLGSALALYSPNQPIEQRSA